MSQFTSVLGSIYYRDRFSRKVDKYSNGIFDMLNGIVIPYGGYSYRKPSDDSL